MAESHRTSLFYPPAVAVGSPPASVTRSIVARPVGSGKWDFKSQKFCCRVGRPVARRRRGYYLVPDDTYQSLAGCKLGYRILKKRVLVTDPKTVHFEVDAPEVAAKAKAGQFIILRVSEQGERIPLTIAQARADDGVTAIVVQEVGKTTHDLCNLEEGQEILDFAGPLGQPTHVEKRGTVCCVGGGIGNAVVWPQASAFREAGNKVISIIGARTKDLLILEDEIRAVSDETIVTTDDGSYGREGLVTDALKEVCERETVDECITIGPVIMMKFVAATTKPFNVPTQVSLNPIMVDGTGMCGACRVTVGGQTKFACVDGPEFDGHLVDFDELMKRLAYYRDLEKVSYDRALEHECRCGKCEGGE